MTQQVASIDEFVCRYFSLQQTALVDNLLNEDKHMDMYNYLSNLHLHTVELSTGTFTGTHNQLMTKKAAIRELQHDGDNQVLQEDIERLETAQGTQRIVYEWYNIPYWIARHMIDSDEVVLSWRDCYWWGRVFIAQSVQADVSIKDLYQCYLNASP